MSQPRKAQPSEQLRLRAACCVEEGQDPQEIAQLLDVSKRSVWRWWSLWRERGQSGLSSKPHPGRPPKLSLPQQEQVLMWLEQSPLDFGFTTERWTAPRVARLIEQRWRIRMNKRYLSDWLRRRGITPQMPQRVPRERDQAMIDAWVSQQWPRIKKKLLPPGRALFLRTNPAFC
jgi:transposase